MKQYLAPTGAMIVGVVRVADVTTYIAGINGDGTPIVEEGENEVDWASLRDKGRAGATLFEDENRQTWTFADLSPIDPENEPDV